MWEGRQSCKVDIDPLSYMMLKGAMLRRFLLVGHFGQQSALETGTSTTSFRLKPLLTSLCLMQD